jgi:PAS domain S-box-containing protein
MTGDRRRQKVGDDGAGEELGFQIGRDLLCTMDADGYFVSMNAAWEGVLGWTRKELMQRPFIDFVHPDDVERTVNETSKVTQPDSEMVDFENRYRTKDGAWRWLRWSAHSDGETWFAVAFDVTERKRAEERLRGALTEDRLLAYSQPILDQRRGLVVQEELLVRLRASDHGELVIAPSAFLPEAERYGLIGVVDRWMIGEGVAQAGRGSSSSINLSALSITDEALAAAIEKALAAAGSGAGKIVFEITETAAIEHLDAARDFAERLVRLGCRFALDDFGTGYGSLTYLRHLPVEFLKIDTSFVRDVAHSAEDRALVRSVVAIARELGAQTVAEGVENAATLRTLRSCGVDHVQGYLIGRPRPLAEGAQLVSQQPVPR